MVAFVWKLIRFYRSETWQKPGKLTGRKSYSLKPVLKEMEGTEQNNELCVSWNFGAQFQGCVCLFFFRRYGKYPNFCISFCKLKLKNRRQIKDFKKLNFRISLKVVCYLKVIPCHGYTELQDVISHKMILSICGCKLVIPEILLVYRLFIYIIMISEEGLLESSRVNKEN